MTKWYKYPDVTPSDVDRYTDFLVAYPNPRLFTSKFANVRFNDGRPPYLYDVANWTGDKFAIIDTKVRFWAVITSPEVKKNV